MIEAATRIAEGTGYIGDLIDQLLSGITQSPPWYSFLESLEHYLNCRHATIVLRLPRPGVRGVVVSTTQTAWSLQAFHEQASGTNFLAEVEPGKVHSLRKLFSEEQLQAQPYYSEYLSMIGIDDLLILNLKDLTSGMTFRLRCARDHSEPRFNLEEIEALTALMPRIKTAFEIYARLSTQDLELEIYDDLAGRVAVGAILIGSDGKVIKSTPTAKQILDLRDGIEIRDGKSFCRDSKAATALRRATQTIINRTRSDAPADDIGLTVPRRDGKRYWNLLCRSVAVRTKWDGARAPAMLILIRSSGQVEDICPERLVDLFGLTNAEARLAAMLAKGASLSSIALTLDVSRCTVRCQLSSIFEKTGCHRQSQLIMTILNATNSVWLTGAGSGDAESSISKSITLN